MKLFAADYAVFAQHLRQEVELRLMPSCAGREHLCVLHYADERTVGHVFHVQIRPFPSRMWYLHAHLVFSYHEERLQRDMSQAEAVWCAKLKHMVQDLRLLPAYRTWRNSLKLFRMNGQRWAV